MDYEGATVLSPDEWGDLTSRLHEASIRHVAELAQVQVDLRRWYAAQLSTPSAMPPLDRCPSLLRVMKIIRLLRECQLEYEEKLNKSGADEVI